MQGGPSHLDLFDPKPELTRRSGKTFTGDVKFDNAGQASSKLFGSPWKFRTAHSGIELSELLPYLGEVADLITLVRSMHTGVNNHGQSISALNSGRISPGRPVVGSWLTYALGSESQELPAYCVLTDPGGLPVLGVDNWQAGWLPSLYQGTVVRPTEPRIPNLGPALASPGTSAGALSSAFSTSSIATISPSTLANTTSPLGSPATSSPRGCRRPQPKRLDLSRESPATRDLRAGRRGNPRVRQPLPDRSTPGRAGSASSRSAPGIRSGTITAGSARHSPGCADGSTARPPLS